MAWSRTRDPFAEQNIQNTNILVAPAGKGVPVSSKEFNVSFLLRAQAEQEILRSLAPSGFSTRIVPTSTVETTSQLDVDGELVALKTNGVAVPNTLRLGRSSVVVNGWKVALSNVDGTNSLHNNVVLDAPPSSGSRVDLVFLEVWLAELGGTSASISNTANKPSATTLFKYGNTQFRGTNATDDIAEVDAEVNRRWQIQYRVRVVNGIDIDTYPDGIDHTTVVKAWGANPGNLYSGYTSGNGTPYTFQRSTSDAGLFVAGDGSTTAKSVLGTVDGYVFAIPLTAVFRRNTGAYDPNTNPLGCAAAGPTGGLIASGVSGRPDGTFADQISEFDILSLRHQIFLSEVPAYSGYASETLDRLMRGNLTSMFGRGDGSGSPNGLRSTYSLYAQEISQIANLDAGFKGFAEFNYQRRIFSDAATVQQTQFTFTGGATPDGQLPTVLSAPAGAAGFNAGSTNTSSGTLGAGSYYVKLTYTNAYGETLPSNESAALVLGSTGNITINSPVASGNASGWNCYITTTSGSNWRKQNSVPVAIGTNYTQSAALSGSGAVVPAANTTSSTIVITASNAGMTNGTAYVKCVDGSTTAGAGSLQGNKNIIVYNASTGTEVAGSWANLGTATATFTPTSPWAGGDTTNGVVAIVGLAYPAGNGMTYRAENVVAQSLVQGGTTYNMAQIGVSGVAAADDSHLNTPSDAVVDSSGNIFVTDAQNHRIVKYNSSFVKQAQFGVTGVSGADNTHLNNPQCVIVDSANNIYVSDTGNHRIVKLTSSLTYAAQFGVTGVAANDNSHLSSPYQIAFDNTQGNIYVADSGNKRIVRITNAMAFGAVPTNLSALTYNPYGVGTMWDGSYNQLVVTQGHSVVKYTTADGTTYSVNATLGTAATAGNTKYLLNTPMAVTVVNSALNTGISALQYKKDVLVCDTNNHRIVQLNPVLNYVAQFGVTSKTGTDMAHLNQPYDVATDAAGLLYIVDAGNHRVLKLHSEMGACDFPTRQFETLSSGSGTDRLKVWYNYRPYQGVIAYQGSTTMNYTLRALTDMQALVSTCGTGGRNAKTEDNLNGFLVRMPLPYGAFGTTPSSNELEFKFDGSDLTVSGNDVAGIIGLGNTAWGGGMATYGATDPAGYGGSSLLAGQQIRIAQNTLGAGYPFRGVNTIQRYVPNLPQNNGWDALGMSFGAVSAVDHITCGYFLAAASGGSASLPLVQGEVVLVIVSFRTTGGSAAIYGQTNVATAVDIFRLPGRPLVRY